MLADYLSNEIFGMIFLSGYRIVEEKKRYDKLNDAAYSALKCRDCAANVFFNCDITVKAGDRQCSGKSPMALMAAGFKCGTEIEITCDGSDEKECLDRAIEIVKNGLGEPLAL